MLVLSTISQLLKFQGKCTIAEIAKIAGLKQSEVLSILNTNLPLLVKSQKNKSVIIGLNSYPEKQRNYLLSNGYYEYGNYYSNKLIYIIDKKLVPGYYEYGHLYWNEERQKFLDDNGYKLIQDSNYLKVVDLWNEKINNTNNRIEFKRRTGIEL